MQISKAQIERAEYSLVNCKLSLLIYTMAVSGGKMNSLGNVLKFLPRGFLLQRYYSHMRYPHISACIITVSPFILISSISGDSDKVKKRNMMPEGHPFTSQSTMRFALC